MLWKTARVEIVGLILFMALGFGLGFALELPRGLIALALPVLFAVLTGLTKGVDARLFVVLAIALALTAISVVAGALLARFLERRGAEV